MRTRKLIALSTLLAVGFGGVLTVRALAAPKIDRDTKLLMQKKLGHAQDILAALSIEDYPTIKREAEELALVGMEAEWRSQRSPRYSRLSSEFRVLVEAMARAAEEENLDGVTLNYIKTITSCVDCHKLVRGSVEVAEQK